MLNKVFIMGRLGADPELRRTQSGISVTSFRLAVDRDFKDKQTGERATDWIDVTAWRQTGEFVSRYFTKGRTAVVEGRLQVQEWTRMGTAGALSVWWPITCTLATPGVRARDRAHRLRPIRPRRSMWSCQTMAVSCRFRG